MGISSNVNNSGFRDWMIQRVTAVVVLLYITTITLMLFLDVPKSHWQSLFSNLWMQIITLVALLSVCWHAWIGLWTVLTDYVHHRTTRYALEITIIGLMLFYVIWLVKIFGW